MASTATFSIMAIELSSSRAQKSSAIVSTMNAGAKLNESRLAELLEAVARQDRAAFETFYDATTECVSSLVLRITQKTEIAEEVMGDVYLQVWRQADRFDPTRGNALAWLTTLCRSRALDTVRKAVNPATAIA